MNLPKKVKTLFSKKPAKPIFGNYKTSSHVQDYERIAMELKTTPQHIYEIAHGKSLVCYDDDVIWDRLLQEGIVTRH